MMIEVGMLLSIMEHSTVGQTVVGGFRGLEGCGGYERLLTDDRSVVGDQVDTTVKMAVSA